MTDSKDGARETPKANEGPGQKRPHATLELKATEIKSATPAPPPPPGTPQRGASGAEAKNEAPKAEPHPNTTAAPPSPPPRRRGGFISHLLAGVAGGALALVAADRYGDQLGLRQDAATADLNVRFATLEKAVSEKVNVADLARTQKETDARLAKIAEIETNVSHLGDAQGKLASDTSVRDRVAKIEERFDALLAAAEQNGDTGRVAGLAALSSKLTALAESVDGKLAEARKAVNADVAAELGAATEANRAGATALDQLGKDLMALKTEAGRLSERIEAVKAGADQQAYGLEALRRDGLATASALMSLKSAIEQQMSSVARSADVMSVVTPVTGKLAEFEKRLDSVVKGEDERRANASRVVMALELSNLKRAIDSGKPFAEELATIRSEAGDKTALAALEPFKDKGVASFQSLEQEFRDVIPAVLDGAPAADQGDGSFLGHLTGFARSAMKIRKIDHAPDDKSAEAVLGRMETALKERHLDSVLTLAKDLPAEAAAGAKAWLAEVSARFAADQAIVALETELKSSLAAGGSGDGKTTN